MCEEPEGVARRSVGDGSVWGVNGGIFGRDREKHDFATTIVWFFNGNSCGSNRDPTRLVVLQSGAGVSLNLKGNCDVREAFELGRHSGEREDHMVLTKAQWDFLYKECKFDCDVCISVIFNNQGVDHLRDWTNGIKINIIVLQKNGIPERAGVWLFTSRHVTISDLSCKLAHLFSMNDNRFRLWTCDAYDYSNLGNLNLLEDARSCNGLNEAKKILVEKCLPNGAWIFDEIRSKVYCNGFHRALNGGGLNGRASNSIFKKNFDSYKKKFWVKKFNWFFHFGGVLWEGGGGCEEGRNVLGGDDKYSYYVALNSGICVKSLRNHLRNIHSVVAMPGLCGLKNLGNTCYMNSGLQCLSHCVILRDYFLQNLFLKEMNKTNSVEMKDRVAEQFGILLKKMWSSEFNCITPRCFKKAIDKCDQRFEGCTQNDSQELLSFLLDALHEDLNRVDERRQIRVDQSRNVLGNKSDRIAANEAWMAHLSQNNSIITDLFHGLLKSTVQCPKCNTTSVTFDPFMYLSLPLVGIEAERRIEMNFWYFDRDNFGAKYAVQVPGNETPSELKTYLAMLVNIEPSLVVLVRYSKRNGLHFLSEDEDISMIDDDDLVLGFGFIHRKSKRIPCFQRCRGSIADDGDCGWGAELPFFVEVFPGITTGLELYQWLFDRLLKNFLPDFSECVRLSSFEYPFRLVFTDERNVGCCLCNAKCGGCSVSPSEDPVLTADQSSWTIYLGIEWIRDDKANFQVDFGALDAIKSHSHFFAKNDRRSTRIGDTEIGSDNLDFEECLNLFTKNERLNEDNAWYCSRCNNHITAWKKFQIWKLPRYLVVHLKRFQFLDNEHKKLLTLVHFPLTNLNLDKSVINPEQKGIKYNLFATSNHIGTLNSGHYTAFTKNDLDGKWYLFDDTKVTTINSKDIVSSNAYLLFYERAQNRKFENLTDN